MSETPRTLECDVSGCKDEACIRVGTEQRCYRHALERGNEVRSTKGLPPIIVDEQGSPHVKH